MENTNKSTGVGGAVYLITVLSIGLYFTFASVQGDYGLFSRVQIQAETRALLRERNKLRREIASLSNKTHRISDAYLDLDLLDELSRHILGYARADEVVLR